MKIREIKFGSFAQQVDFNTKRRGTNTRLISFEDVPSEILEKIMKKFLSSTRAKNKSLSTTTKNGIKYKNITYTKDRGWTVVTIKLTIWVDDNNKYTFNICNDNGGGMFNNSTSKYFEVIE